MFLIPLLGAFGLAIGGSAAARGYERSAAGEIAGRLGGTPVVRVKARTGLPILWGEAGTVTIEARDFTARGLPFETEPWRSRYGKLNRLRLEFRDFELSGLAVRRLSAEIPRCRFDLGLATGKRQFRLSRSGVGRGRVEVGASALAAFAMRKFPALRSLTLSLQKGRFRAEGRAFLLAELAFVATGELVVEGGVRLKAQGLAVEIDGRPAPALAAGFSKAFDPLVDLDAELGLRGALHVERLKVDDDLLIADGRMIIPETVRS